MSMRLLCNGKVIEDATWADVEAVLPELKNEAFFDLAIRPEPESGPEGLEVQSQDGNYMPVLGIANTGELREFINRKDRGKPEVSIGGYTYDPTSVTQDFDLIVRMIKEFYETGDVSEELLE